MGCAVDRVNALRRMRAALNDEPFLGYPETEPLKDAIDKLMKHFKAFAFDELESESRGPSASTAEERPGGEP